MRVLITDRFLPQMESRLQTELHCDVKKSQTTSPMASELSEVEVMIIRSKTVIYPELLKQAPQLKLILSTTAGFDHIDYESCKKRGIHVMHTPSAHTQSVAELTIGFMLDLTRGLSTSYQVVNEKKWRESLPMGEELWDKTLGLIGLGRIGGRVAQIATVMGLKVQAYDPYVEDLRFQNLQVSRVGLTELFRTSDIVSLHVPLTRETYHMIHHRTIEEMSTETVLINTARGDLVCEDSLYQALMEKRLRAAALDVYAKEPLTQNSRWFQCPSLLMTPHIGAYTDKAFYRSNLEAFQKLKDFLQENRICDSVPPNVPWQDLFLAPSQKK